LLTYAAVGSDVKTSIIDGVLVMEGRRLLTIDLEETMARVRSLARQVRKAF
jgi:5-methylthioadenosine/S-adenosylhomocysteine deaminase